MTNLLMIVYFYVNISCFACIRIKSASVGVTVALFENCINLILANHTKLKQHNTY